MEKIFEGLVDYKEYLTKNPFYKKLGINLQDYEASNGKEPTSPYRNIDPSMMEPISADLDDLVRLHFLATSRKATTILEFGVGKSTVVLDDALTLNKQRYEKYVKNELRRSNAFECHSVDNIKHWIDVCKATAETDNVSYHFTKCSVSSFNGRVCTFYDSLPNICPDLIYVDAPDQFSPEGDVRGINTNHRDRWSMAADLLAIEYFLLPGALIIVDGRTTNARFLRQNLQRNWSYQHIVEMDQHFFELLEEPIGIYNKKQIDFCLGDEFYIRLKNSN